MSVMYFCWLCQVPVHPGGAILDRHYEDGHAIRFCSKVHYREYTWLRDL